MLGRRLRGQDEAVERSLDIVVRSVMGLSGAQAAAQVSKPRGVLFFAGPTGVGKTELAKALTELIFGDERAYIRFDMSEFAAEHAAERLAGAPPGYLGHDAGGELTNAVRKQPFSLILFDEIEKAHPRVMDKFLQILDDGRLTDGSGSTVYFSESVIVFTSNLGLKVLDERGLTVQNVTPSMGRLELEERMTTAVRQHFIEALDRPELLNRIGDNIVVFNFISDEAAGEIFQVQLDRVISLVQRQRGVRIRLSSPARATLHSAATAAAVLEFGGRGIGSLLERAFVNPLARALFSIGAGPGEELMVTEVRNENGQWSLVLQREDMNEMIFTAAMETAGPGSQKVDLVQTQVSFVQQSGHHSPLCRLAITMVPGIVQTRGGTAVSDNRPGPNRTRREAVSPQGDGTDQQSSIRRRWEDPPGARFAPDVPRRSTPAYREDPRRTYREEAGPDQDPGIRRTP